MSIEIRRWFLPVVLGAAVLVAMVPAAVGQPTPPRSSEFPPGALKRIEDLPAGRFRTQLDHLAPSARQQAFRWLQRFHFTELDLDSLHADADGGVFYVDTFSTDSTPAAAEPPVTSQAAVPVSPFPSGLVFHSRPGAPNVLYLNFTGEDVSGTAWNTSLGRTLIPTVAFSSDADYSTFSDSEQLVIKRVWQRVAEDYAPFNIDVTTERPASFGTRTAHALITRSTDANGDPNPSSTAGGVAYINVFAAGYYANYQPVWIYCNNLSSSEAYISEAVSHEIGHNLGLSHDGKTDGTSYYGGHGSGADTSWGPIMGTGYNRNVSQWSKGEYYLANNTEDDLAIMAGKISYRADDHGDTRGAATALIVTGGTNVVSTTPENDPTNSNPDNKGLLEQNPDVDVFSFVTGSGQISLTVNPWIMPSGTRGGNLDILLELYDVSGALLLTNNASSKTYATIQTTLTAGIYYLYVRNTGVGDPLSSTPSGYTSYASLGQYFITGYVVTTPNFLLTASANNPAWGTVNPAGGTYQCGTSIQVTAQPAAYYQFVDWTGDAAGTNVPLTLLLDTNKSLQAVFSEILTTNHPTPCWWLAACGYTTNFESAVMEVGSNGVPMWQSYIAGLNPNDPTSQLRLSLTLGADGSSVVVNWEPVTGRVYTLWSGTDPMGAFAPVPNAVNLPATVNGFTNAINPDWPTMFYRLEVQRP